MPIYEYFCNLCDQEFEASHSIKDELDECPLCKEMGYKSSPPTKLISKTSFVLNGSCWSKDNYSK